MTFENITLIVLSAIGFIAWLCINGLLDFGLKPNESKTPQSIIAFTIVGLIVALLYFAIIGLKTSFFI